MTPSIPLNLNALYESPYAAELRRGVGKLRFAPVMEEEFVNGYLQHCRFRVRIWWATATVALFILTLLRAPELQLWSVESVFRAGFLSLLAWSLWLSFGPQFERRYQKLSPLLVPVASCATVILNTTAIMRGDETRLVAIVATMMCVFVISGALFRTAMMTCLLILGTYATMMWNADLLAPFKMASVMWMSIVALVSIVFGWDNEKLHRQTFLESRLNSELAELDGLTHIRNYRAFEAHLQRVWQQAARDRRNLAVMMIDVDHFKRYNDHYGHQAGDAVLKRIAGIIDGFARRPFDLAARYGGEEFSIILYDMAPEYVMPLAEQLRQVIEKQAIEHKHSSTASEVTVSIGGALVLPAPGRSPKAIVQMADEALYAAKQAGRNRVELNATDYTTVVTGVFNMPKRHG
jgi:diguanylate cyclase (GGDEF)-like protein